jgi:hypothetical protein
MSAVCVSVYFPIALDSSIYWTLSLVDRFAYLLLCLSTHPGIRRTATYVNVLFTSCRTRAWEMRLRRRRRLDSLYSSSQTYCAACFFLSLSLSLCLSLSLSIFLSLSISISFSLSISLSLSLSLSVRVCAISFSSCSAAFSLGTKGKKKKEE